MSICPRPQLASILHVATTYESRYSSFYPFGCKKHRVPSRPHTQSRNAPTRDLVIRARRAHRRRRLNGLRQVGLSSFSHCWDSCRCSLWTGRLSHSEPPALRH